MTRRAWGCLLALVAFYWATVLVWPTIRVKLSVLRAVRTDRDRLIYVSRAIADYVERTGRFPVQSPAHCGEDGPASFLFRTTLLDNESLGRLLGNLRVARVLVVFDDGVGGYREGTAEELKEQEKEKFIVDVWGNPICYRRLDEDTAVLWSFGPNHSNDSGMGDDILVTLRRRGGTVETFVPDASTVVEYKLGVDKPNRR